MLYEPECIGFEKPHTSAGEEFRRTSRIVARGLCGFATLYPEIKKNPFRFWQFLSHKFLRWFTLPLALGLVISAALIQHSLFSTFIFLCGLLGFSSAVSGMLILRFAPSLPLMKPFTLLAHLLIMNSGACWGLLMTLMGKTPATWTIPQSSRDK